MNPAPLMSPGPFSPDQQAARGRFGAAGFALFRRRAAVAVSIFLTVGSTMALEARTNVSLDGADWRIAADPDNIGREQAWYAQSGRNAQVTRVPWIIQDALPGYHGVAWYWKTFTAPSLPSEDGRYVLHFDAVNYRADVWLNGIYLGSHENGETPFRFDATDAVRPQVDNVLAVRVLDPLNGRPIDGIDRLQVPHRGSGTPQHGGIEGSVTLAVVSAVHLEDLHALSDWKTGKVDLSLTVRNATPSGQAVEVEVTVEEIGGAGAVAVHREALSVPPGRHDRSLSLQVPRHKLWSIDQPTLYRVTVILGSKTSRGSAQDNYAANIGFRDFRLRNGYFELNGRRIYVRSAHTANHSPMGIWVPPDVGAEPDLLGLGLIRAKEMGFNMIRFLGGIPRRNLVELCDRIGLMLYVESMASWHLQDSAFLQERFNRAIEEMVTRDRNSPSVVLWGLLNETYGGEPVHHAAVAALPRLRVLDPSRLVALSSGRWDRHLGYGSFSNPGSSKWNAYLGHESADGGPTDDLLKMGHVHRYLGAPLNAGDIQQLRTIGAGAAAPVLYGEAGVGSGQDIPAIRRALEKNGGTHLQEYRRIREFEADFDRIWSEWNLDEVFGSKKRYFSESVGRMAPRRLVMFNAIRANPRFNGHSHTSFADYAHGGEGVLTQWREYKPGAKEAMLDAWAPLRFSAFVEPWNIERNADVQLEVVLANEDVLSAGTYPVRLSITDERGAEVWSDAGSVNIREGEADFALPFFKESIRAAWPQGRYRLNARFADGRAAAGGDAEFNVWESTKVPGHIIPSVYGKDEMLCKWLTRNRIRTRPYRAEDAPHLVLVSGKLDRRESGQAQRNLRGSVGRGAVVIVLDPRFFGTAENWLAGLPVDGLQGTLETARNGGWLYVHDAFRRDHPVFNGLGAAGMFDDLIFRNVLRSDVWLSPTPPTHVVAGMINTSLQAYGRDFRWGLLLGEYRQGQGLLVVNMLNISEHLLTDPVADRLLKNMLRHYHDVATRQAGERQR